MRRIWTMLLLAGTLRGADVSLWMSGYAIVENAVMAKAKDQVARMFGAIGVNLEWTRGIPTACRENTVEVRFTSGNATWQPGPLAYSTPFDAQPVITVFYDRVKSTAQPEFRTRLLAHVLVHEIAHVLMRTKDHASEGVMKAHWTTSDYIQMAHGSLPFMSMDKDLVRNGLKSFVETKFTCHATLSQALDGGDSQSRAQGEDRARTWPAERELK